MNSTVLTTRRTALAAAAMLCLLGSASRAAEATAAAAANAYTAHALVSDGVASTAFTDASLKNTWGLAFKPFGFVWVANNHAGNSTLYDGTGVPQTLVVSVPPADGSAGLGLPTGITYGGSNDFAVTSGALTGPSRFLLPAKTA